MEGSARNVLLIVSFSVLSHNSAVPNSECSRHDVTENTKEIKNKIQRHPVYSLKAPDTVCLTSVNAVCS